MKEIGGYFELELGIGEEYHKNAIKLNLGRTSFEYILKCKKISKVFIPYYTCDAIIGPLRSLNIDFTYYSIDENLEPVFDYSLLNDRELMLLTNYFGLKGEFIKNITKRFKNIIVDNSQAFFDTPIELIDTFYSPRKFFGVPDGGYLYTDLILKDKMCIDISMSRFDHLLGRIEKSAEEFYGKFKSNEEILDCLPIMKMSNITKRILQSINYSKVAKARISNYKYLESKLFNMNRLNIEYKTGMVPMIYPLFLPKNKLREKLSTKKLFVPLLWPNVLKWCTKNSLEFMLAEGILPLPVDQRYDEDDMRTIVKILKSC